MVIRSRAIAPLLCATVLALAGCLPRPVDPGATPSDRGTTLPTSLGGASETVTQAWRSADFVQLPLYFIENRGHVDPRVSHYVYGRGATVYFTSEGITYSLLGRTTDDGRPTTVDEGEPSSVVGRPSSSLQRWAIKVDFLGANQHARADGADRTEAIFGYFRGTPDEWKTGLPSYAGVVYADLWPGIDLVYRGETGQLKYALVVRPGADPRRIALAYRGATDVRLAEDGGLDVRVPFGGFREERPYTYQEVDGQRVEVASAFALAPDPELDMQVVGFDVGPYDPARTLVIDPTVVAYAGYIGGTNPNGFDAANGVAADRDGSAYVVGGTTSKEDTFPETVGPELVQDGSVDAFVAKVRSDGTGLVYAGYVGGVDRDDGLAIAVDGDGSAYLAGTTFSNSTTHRFPVTTGSFDATHNGSGDIFVAKVNPGGTALVYATYVGGAGVESGQGIALEPGCQGNCSAYITGDTTSSHDAAVSNPPFPARVGPRLTFSGGVSTTGSPTDAYVAKLDPSGSNLIYAGYIGGSRNESGREIAVDRSGNAYVVGFTDSTQTQGFPVTAGSFDTTHNGNNDAFVAKVRSDGTDFVYVTYLGGSASDAGFQMGIAVDDEGHAYVAGETLSGASAATPFPTAVGPDTTHAGSNDVFVAKLNPAGSALVYSGFVGGSQAEAVGGIAVDGAGNAHVTGRTASSTAQGFPAANGPDSDFGGNADAFVAKVRPDGSGFVFVTYLGGNQLEEGLGIALDPGGGIYIAGNAGNAGTDSLPVLVGPDLTFNGGGSDGFVAKFVSEPADLVVGLQITPDPVVVGGSLTYTVTVTNAGPSPVPDAVVTVSWPPIVSFGSAAPSQGTCTREPGRVRCVLGFIQVGETATVSIAVTPTQTGTIATTATAVSGSTDPNPANNVATRSVAAIAPAGAPAPGPGPDPSPPPPPTADLGVTLADAPDPFVVGQLLTYTASVFNAGPSTATAVKVIAALTTGGTLDSASPSQGTCARDARGALCDLGNLTVGARATVTFGVTPTEGAPVAMTASVTAGEPDPVLGGNTAAQSTDPARFDLTVARAGNGTGTVTSSPPGINCGPDCTEAYLPNTVVTLIPTPARNSFFAGWTGGGCAGLRPCAVTVDAAKTVTATFTRPRCLGQLATIVGTPGNDVLVGTAGPDVIVSREGNDVVRGFGGNDRICLGPGNDRGFGGPGNDLIEGEDGNDLLVGELGNDRLTGGAGVDVLDGSAGVDVLDGGAGVDTLRGGPGNDLLLGGPGQDRVFGGPGIDLLRGGADRDLLFGEADNDRLFGEAGNDALNGGAGADTCNGGPNVDTAVACEVVVGVP